MTTPLDWPIGTLRPTDITLDLVYASRSAGQPWAGVEQVISPLTSRWQLSMGLNVGRETRARAYRSLKATLKGRYGEVNIPLCDPYRVKFADAGWPDFVPAPGIPFSDGAFFSDGSGFASPDITTTVALGAVEGEEWVWIDVSEINDALGVGHFLSINDFLYVVRFDGFGSKVGTRRHFGIAPELRERVVAGDEVKIGRPQIRCRLADDASGSAAMQFGRFGTPTMDFVEVFQR